MAHKILMVEDDFALAMGTEYALTSEGYAVATAGNLAQAREKFDDSIDLVLLDVMLPDGTGFEFCKELREKNSDVPIIFLTAVAEEANIVQGLEIGADDYVTKPFAPMELMARVNSQLRRYSRYLKLAAGSRTEEPKEHFYVVGGLELNEDTVEVSVDGNPVTLTPLEFKILALLMRNPGRVFSPEEIYERIWNEKPIGTETIMVHIRNIRTKIEVNPKNPKYLKVVWGVGYKIEKQ